MKLLATLLAVLPLAASAAFQPDVVIDDLDSTDVEFVGSWVDDSNTTYALRTSAKVTTGNTTNVTEYARFHKQLRPTPALRLGPSCSAISPWTPMATACPMLGKPPTT